MRNLKRVLSLALACVMVIGMMVMTTGAADLVDYDEITRNEAVDVMVALGVLEGDENSYFNPNDTLTREQAAKIICAMLIGPGNAKKLTGTSDFTDVEAGRWSAPYIAYCANLGIIAGNGDGTFNPEGKLTSLAFGKMLLVALGYDAEIEGYIYNNNWSNNIGSDMITSGIDVKDVELTAELTREQAAQMAFNALQATMVEYKNNSTITVGDITIQSNPTATNVANTGYNNEYGANKATSLQFSEKYFTTLHNTGVNKDLFGRPATTWSIKNEVIGIYGDTANKVYTKGMKNDAMMGIADYTLNGGSVTPVVNGKAAGTPCTSLNDIVGLTGNGVVVELFFDFNTPTQINNIVVINTEFAQVTSESTARMNLTSKNAAVVGALTISKDEDIFADVTAAYDVDDYALVVPLWDATDSKYYVYSIVDADSVQGIITDTVWNAANSANDALAVDGVEYEAAATAHTTVTGAVVNVTNSVSTVWLDEYGYAVFAKTAPGAVNSFVYVLKPYQTLKDGVITPMAKVVKTNGTIADVETAALATAGLNEITSVTNGVYTLNNSITAITGASGDDTATNGTTNMTQIGTSGIYYGYTALTATQGIEAYDKTLTTDNAGNGTDGWNNYYASDVKFVYVDTTNKTAVVKEGVQKTASIPATAYALLETNSKNDATMVVKMVILENATATSAEVDQIIYMKDNKAASVTTMTNVTTGKDVAVSVYDVYQNGEKISLAISGGTAAKGFFTYAESESIPGSYVIVSYAATTGAAAQKVDKAVTGVFDGRMATADSVTVDLTAATAIVDLRAMPVQNSKPIVLTAAGLCEAYTNYNGLNLSFIYDADKGNAAVVYVTGQGTGYTVTEQAATALGGSAQYATTTTGSKVGGDTMTVTVTTSNAVVDAGGIEIDVKVNGDVVGTVSFAAGDAIGSTATCTFTMPAANATITLVLHS